MEDSLCIIVASSIGEVEAAPASLSAASLPIEGRSRAPVCDDTCEIAVMVPRRWRARMALRIDRR